MLAQYNIRLKSDFDPCVKNIASFDDWG